MWSAARESNCSEILHEIIWEAYLKVYRFWPRCFVYSLQNFFVRNHKHMWCCSCSVYPFLALLSVHKYMQSIYPHTTNTPCTTYRILFPYGLIPTPAFLRLSFLSFQFVFTLGSMNEQNIEHMYALLHTRAILHSADDDNVMKNEPIRIA